MRGKRPCGCVPGGPKCSEALRLWRDVYWTERLATAGDMPWDRHREAVCRLRVHNHRAGLSGRRRGSERECAGRCRGRAGSASGDKQP